MTHSVLATYALSKTFGKITAVDRVNLQVRAGDVFGFLGPNGAGKTTTIGLILGLMTATNGRVELFGQPVSPRYTRPLRRVGALIGAPTLLPYLSGRDNLRLLAQLYPDISHDQVEALLARVGMKPAAGRKFATYSTGMKQRLGLAAALLHKPELVLLDEPTSGLDPSGMHEMRELIRALADEGTTIFLSSHLLHEVEQICDHIAVINNGRIVAQGAVHDLLGATEQTVKLSVPDPAAAKKALSTLPQVQTIQSDGRQLTVSGIASETAVAHLVAHNIVPSEVTTTQSDLETVFLALTRSLQEGEPDDLANDAH